MARKIFDIVVDPHTDELKDVMFPIGDHEILAITAFKAGFGTRGVVFTVFGDDQYMRKVKIHALKRGETFDEGDRMCDTNLQFLGVANGDGYIGKTKTDASDVFYFKEVY